MVFFKKEEKKQNLLKSLYWIKGKIREHHAEVLWLDSEFWVKEEGVKIFRERKDFFLFPPVSSTGARNRFLKDEEVWQCHAYKITRSDPQRR